MFKWLIAGSLLLAAAGCSGDGDTDGPDGQAGSAGSDAGSGGGGAGEGGTGGGLEIPQDETDTGWTPSPPAALDGGLVEVPRPGSCSSEFGWMSSVRGWAVAPGGKPLEGARAQLCINTSEGGYICLSPAVADAEGVYTVDVPEEVRCMERVAMRVILPRSNRATSYCLIDKETGPGVRLHDPSVLPFLLPAIERPELGDEDEGRPVTFDGGLVLDVQPSLFYSSIGSYDAFSGRAIPSDAVGLCGDAGNFDGLFGLYPEGIIEAPGFGLKFPNKKDLPAGSKVDLFVLGGLECNLHDGEKVPEAEWAKFGEATVSEDGSEIVSDEGSGLPCFTWLAYKSKESSK